MQSQPRNRNLPPRPRPRTSFLKSRMGVTVLFFLAVGGLLLVYEHRVHVFSGSGLLIFLLLLCSLMHLFMHGGHGHAEHGK